MVMPCRLAFLYNECELSWCYLAEWKFSDSGEYHAPFDENRLKVTQTINLHHGIDKDGNIGQDLPWT